MDFFRKMSFADSTGDAIPFYHEGKYHIFSLTSPPGTTVYPARLRTTWSHSVSEDLVHWEELPTALYPGEGDEPDASGVWTGSVIYGEGKYHAFYTGYCLTAEYQQTICHATSEDGITWTKDAANPVITPMYSAGNTNCPECSEMYKIGDTWYLSYSRFSEFVNTIYRTSKSPFGPWKKPKKDGIGGRRFYAAKSMQDDNGRRFYFAWAHDRAENSDRGEWYWGGTFCIPHEVVATADGQLDVKLPEEYVNCFKEKVDWKYLPVMGEYKLYGDTTVELDGCGTTAYGFLEQPEEKFLFTGTVIPKEANDSFGILLKSDWEASGCLFLEFDVAMQRVSLLSLPMGVDPFWEQSCQAVPKATEPGPDGVRVAEKTFEIKDGQAIDVKISVDHDMVEVFVGEQVAFTYRIFRKPEYELGLLAQDAKVEFANIAIRK